MSEINRLMGFEYHNKTDEHRATDLLRELMRTMAMGSTFTFDRVEDGANFAIAKRAAERYLAELAERYETHGE